MLEHLFNGGGVSYDGPDSFTFLGESTVVGTYTDIATACGMTTGTLMPNLPLLSFKPNDRDETWYVPKSVIRHTFSLELPFELGIAKGKEVVINGVVYTVRLLRGATGTVVNHGLNSAYYYTANDEYINSEFNKMFYPILGLAGSSVEGIPYGTQAKYTQIEIGFSSAGGTAQASVMQEREIQNNYYLIVQGSNGLRNRIVRTGGAVSGTGWRPVLIKKN